MPDRDLTDPMDDHEPGPWIECWSCGGEGYHDDCFEDTCVCLDPPCSIEPCDICEGAGGWIAKAKAGEDGDAA